MKIILIIYILFTYSFGNNINDERKKLYLDYKNKVVKIKKRYLLNRNNISEEYNNLISVYNIQKEEYLSLKDSIDQAVKMKIYNYNKGNNDIDVEGYKYKFKDAISTKDNKLTKRKIYYDQKFMNLDSITTFYFDQVLKYETNKINMGDIILNLQAENIALVNRINNSTNNLNNLEYGISLNNLNESILALINVDMYIYEKKYNKAISECKIAINNFPDLYLAYEKLGSAYYLNNNYDDALNSWETALAMEPNNTKLIKFLNAIKK